MSKNINLNRFPFNVVASTLLAVALLSANSAAWAQMQPYPTGTNVYGLIDVVDNGNIVSIAPPLQAMVGWCYAPGSWIDDYLNFPYLPHWPDSQVTRANNRIPHISGNVLGPPTTYSYQHAWVDYTGDTADAANRLWDTAYSNWGYTKVDPTASIDISMLCHGYSTGYNTWMSLQPALDDDYMASDNFSLLISAITPDAILVRPYVLNSWIQIILDFVVSDHSARIIQVGAVQTNQQNGQRYKLIEVQEKNRVSALYKKWFTVFEQLPVNSNVVVPIDLSWGTVLKFYIKKT